ncbi:tetratricopeptide repeat protein [Pseudoalteromonas fenneropenaei]|uniref:histidine kinase n=1 Tax=Pseudoalteromonas fenneropenaei TaxID=1737459 RepID=A0ABV7CE17_9GAMM
MRVVWLLIWVLLTPSYIYARSVDKEQVLNAEKSQQIQLAQEFIRENAGFNAKDTLDVIATLGLTDSTQFGDEVVVDALCNTAKALLSLGKNQEALNAVEQAFVVLEASNSQIAELWHQVWLRRAIVYSEMARHEEARMDILRLVKDHQRRGETSVLLGKAYVLLGMNEERNSENEGALRAFLEAEQIFKTHENGEGLADLFSKLGNFYRRLGMLDKALHYQQMSLSRQLQLGNDRYISANYNNIGVIYKDLAQYDKAIEMHQLSLARKQALGYTRGMVYSHNNLGEAYRLKGDIPTALAHLQEAERLGNQLNNRGFLGSTYLYYGRIALTQQEFAKAQQYFADAMAINVKDNDLKRIAEINLDLAKLADAQGDSEAALRYVELAVEQTQANKQNFLLFLSYQFLYQFQERQGQIQAALDTLKKYIHIKETILNEESSTNLAVLRVEQEAQLQRVNFDKTRNQLKISQLELEQTKLNRNFLVFAALLFIAVIVVVLMRYYHRQKLQLERNAHQELSAMARRLELALWGTGDILWDWDLLSGVFLRQNLPNELHLPDHMAVNSIDAFAQFIHPEDFARFSQLLRQHIEGKSEFYSVAYRLKHRKSWIWVQDRGKVVEWIAGKPSRMIGILHDITQTKAQELELLALNHKLEERVQLRTAELQHANTELSQAIANLEQTHNELIESEKMAALGKMVAGVSHELNTPLGICLMALTNGEGEYTKVAADFASGKLKKEQLEQFLVVVGEGSILVKRSLKKAIKLIDTLKLIAHNEAINRMLCDCQQLCQIAFNECHQEFPQQKARISFVSPPETYILISDASILAMVFKALVENSFVHGANQEHELLIYLAIRNENKVVTISYRDNGPGFNKCEIERLFEPFYTTERGKGLIGLGLNLVYNLVVNRLNGRVNIDKTTHEVLIELKSE